MANGIATLGSSLGAFGFPPLLQLLVDFYGFQGMCLIMSAVLLNACFGGALYRPLNTNHYRLKAPTQTEMKTIESDVIDTQGAEKDKTTNATQKLLCGEGKECTT